MNVEQFNELSRLLKKDEFKMHVRSLTLLYLRRDRTGERFIRPLGRGAFYQAFTPLSLKKALNVSRSGREGCAPAFVAASAPAAAPHTTACCNGKPCDNAAAKPPLKASPAATVSTAWTGNAGTKNVS